MADQTPFGCPACGYTSNNEEDVKNHMVEMAEDPKHQEYDLKEQEGEV
jgi:hypothetical protein